MPADSAPYPISLRPLPASAACGIGSNVHIPSSPASTAPGEKGFTFQISGVSLWKLPAIPKDAAPFRACHGSHRTRERHITPPGSLPNFGSTIPYLKPLPLPLDILHENDRPILAESERYTASPTPRRGLPPEVQ